MSRMRAVILCIGLGLTGRTLLADDPSAAWNIAPVNTRAIVVVRNMSDFSGKADRVAKIMGLRQPAILEQAMKSSGIRAGLNQEGALLWFFGPQRDGTSPVAYLLPSSDHRRLLRSAGAQKEGDVQQVRIAQRRFLATGVSNYVGFSATDNPSRAWLRVCRDNPGGGDRAIGDLNEYLELQDLGFAVAPLGLREELEFSLPFSSGHYVFPSFLKSLVAEYSLAQEITASAGGVRVTPAAGVITSAATLLNREGSVSRWSATMSRDRRALLRDVPDGDVTFLFATAIPDAWKNEAATAVRNEILKTHPKGDVLGNRLTLESLRGLTLRIRPAHAGEHWTSSIQLQVHCLNAAGSLLAIRDWMALLLAEEEVKLQEHHIGGQLYLTLPMKESGIATTLSAGVLNENSLLITGGGVANLQREIEEWVGRPGIPDESRVGRACGMVRPKCQMITVADIHRLSVWVLDVYIDLGGGPGGDTGLFRTLVDTYGAMFQDAAPLVLGNCFTENMTITELAVPEELLNSIGQVVRSLAPLFAAEGD